MELQDLKVKEVYPSDNNTRTDYNGVDMAELVKSIESVGLLNPIIVRKAGEQRGTDAYEIIAGHRRFHAVKKLGRDTIPARIIEATEDGAQQIRIIENLHRKDLNPIEEAFAFANLRNQHNMDAKAIADMADKTLPYIVRALALLGLPKKVIEAIRDGIMPAAHGHQIARAPEKEREKLAAFATEVNSWTKRVPTLDELKREIEKKIEKDLKRAPFPLDVAAYGGDKMPECNTCPFNTGNQNVLFDGAEAGKCTNPGCFTKRSNFAWKEMRDKVQARNPKLTFIGFGSMPGYMDFKEIKGYPIVKPEDKRIAKNPEKFGFAIMKPSQFDTKKKAAIYIVSLDKKEKPTYSQDNHDYERDRFIQERVNICLIELANKEVPEVGKKHLIQMIEGDADEQQRLFKKSLPELIKILWLGWLGSWQVEDKLEAVGIETKAVMKAAAKEAAKMYDENKSKKEDSK